MVARLIALRSRALSNLACVRVTCFLGAGSVLARQLTLILDVAGITCPIVPGIMPINTYGGFNRMTGFCKTKVPQAMREGLDAVTPNSKP